MTNQNPNENEENVATSPSADAVPKAEKPTTPSEKERELSDEEIAAVAGGAVDAFIWFAQPGVGQEKT